MGFGEQSGGVFDFFPEPSFQNLAADSNNSRQNTEIEAHEVPDPNAMPGDVVAPETFLSQRAELLSRFSEALGDSQTQEEIVTAITDLEGRNPAMTAVHIENLKQQADLY